MTQTREELRVAIKRLIVETLMLRREPESISDDGPLLGPEGLGLDSIDTVTLLAELERQFGLTVRDPGRAQSILQSVDALAGHILSSQAEVAR